MIHRDVKASNIFICSGQPRTVKLLDFGIAKRLAPEESSTWFTTAGCMPGTPSIMAPEQILGGPLQARAWRSMRLGDLSTKCSEVSDHSTHATRTRRCGGTWRRRGFPPSVRIPLSPELDAVVVRCLERLRERCYGAVEDLIARSGRPSTGRRRWRRAAPVFQVLTSGACVPASPFRGPSVLQPLRDEPGTSSGDNAILQRGLDRHGRAGSSPSAWPVPRVGTSAPRTRATAVRRTPRTAVRSAQRAVERRGAANHGGCRHRRCRSSFPAPGTCARRTTFSFARHRFATPH
ncbi:hypothetical protein WMF31_12070 [Sorangium sp. So ce1036]|uniref:protein kinase domain-containing protein n=1 Tax=Sorangium sp. So ce1036 TaxID=3133328 RepID=UPI003F067231